MWKSWGGVKRLWLKSLEGMVVFAVGQREMEKEMEMEGMAGWRALMVGYGCGKRQERMELKGRKSILDIVAELEDGRSSHIVDITMNRSVPPDL